MTLKQWMVLRLHLDILDCYRRLIRLSNTLQQMPLVPVLHEAVQLKDERNPRSENKRFLIGVILIEFLHSKADHANSINRNLQISSNTVCLIWFADVLVNTSQTCLIQHLTTLSSLSISAFSDSLSSSEIR